MARLHADLPGIRVPGKSIWYRGSLTLTCGRETQMASARRTLLLAVVTVLVAATCSADTVVTTALDPVGPEGTLSLRQALHLYTPGRIVFHPSLMGATIHLVDYLQVCTCGGCSVDGDINGDGKPDIMLDGGGMVPCAFWVRADGVELRHLAMGNFSYYGVYIYGGNRRPSGTRVEDCYIGTTLDGRTPARIGVDGIMAPYPIQTTILGNTIASAGRHGVYLYGTTESQVIGNWVGTNPQGDPGLGNGSTGVAVAYGATDDLVAGNVVRSNPYGVVCASGAVRTIVGDNTFSACSTARGVWVTGASTTAAEIGGNTLDACAIRVDAGSRVFTIQANTISDFPQGQGVHVLGAGTKVDSVYRNLLNKCTLDVRDGATVTHITSNTVNALGQVNHIGMKLYGAGTTVENCDGNTLNDCMLCIACGARVTRVNATTITYPADAMYPGMAVTRADTQVGSITDSTMANCFMCIRCGAEVGTIDGNSITGGTLAIRAPTGSTSDTTVVSAVVNNRITDSPMAGIEVTGRCDVDLIEGNSISGSQYIGIYIWGQGGATAATVASIGANTIEGAGSHALYVCGGDARLQVGHIVDNEIRDARGDGIYLTGDSGVTAPDVRGNVIDGTGGIGIRVEQRSDAIVTGNTISRVPDRGIAFIGRATGKIDHNRIDACGCACIAVCCDGTVIDSVHGNDLRGPGNVGVRVCHATVTSVDGNNIAGTPGGGIILRDGARGRIDGNAIADTGCAAIKVADVGTAVESINGNDISEPGVRGIVVCRSSVATIDGNTIAGLSDRGIALAQGATTESIGGNTISNCECACITLHDPGTVAQSVHDNTLTGPGRIGIRLCAGSAAGRIGSNTIQGTGGDGIVLASSSATNPVAVEDNTVNCAGGSGVTAVRQAVATLRRNTILACGGDGVFIGCEAVVDSADDQVTECAGNGFRVTTGSTAEIIGATVSGNAGTGIAVEDAWTRPCDPVGFPASHAVISRCSISDNDALGIDLGIDGVTHNGNKTPPGPNNWIWYPEFKGFAFNQGVVLVVGAAPPNSTVEVYSVGPNPDPSGHGEGPRWLKSVVADANGAWDTAVLPEDLPITSTATLPGGTSEFSDIGWRVRPDIMVAIAPVPPNTFAGDNIYSPPARMGVQTARQAVKALVPAKYRVRVQNDGAVPDTYKLACWPDPPPVPPKRGSGPNAGWKLEGVPAVVGPLNPGEAQTFEVEVTPGHAVPDWQQWTLWIIATSSGGPTAIDRVALVTTRRGPTPMCEVLTWDPDTCNLRLVPMVGEQEVKGRAQDVPDSGWYEYGVVPGPEMYVTVDKTATTIQGTITQFDADGRKGPSPPVDVTVENLIRFEWEVQADSVMRLDQLSVIDGEETRARFDGSTYKTTIDGTECGGRWELAHLYTPVEIIELGKLEF